METLIRVAIAAREQAYAPYSRFAVGAALLCGDGTVHCGCNVENAAFTPGCCAERTALHSAIACGHRDFRAIAVLGGSLDGGDSHNTLCPPCGVCRQALREFCAPESFYIYLAALSRPDDIKHYTLAELLPLSFGGEQIK